MAISFGPFAVGLGKGYISPALASLQEPSSRDDNFMNRTNFYDSVRSSETLTITEQQGSWVASLSLLGALFGGLCSGVIIKQGRRRTLLFISVPLSLSWTLTLFANSVELIYATAFLAGFFSAIVQVSISSTFYGKIFCAKGFLQLFSTCNLDLKCFGHRIIH